MRWIGEYLVFALVLSFSQIGMAQSMKAKSMRTKTSYPSFPYYSSYSDYSSQSLEPIKRWEIDQLKKALRGCMWVDSVADADVPSRPMAMKIEGCGKGEGSDAVLCTGTLKCVYEVGGDSLSTIFFENVTCMSDQKGVCPTGEACLFDPKSPSGLIYDAKFRLEGQPNSSEPKVIVYPNDSAKGAK